MLRDWTIQPSLLPMSRNGGYNSPQVAIKIAVTRPNIRKSDIMKSVGDLQLQRDPYLNRPDCRYVLTSVMEPYDPSPL